MIYDHRTYTIQPGKMGEFLKVYEAKGWPLQKKYLGEPLGYFTSMDIGELNQVVHLWRYESLADRAERRAKLQADPAWPDYLGSALPLVQHMANKILTPAPFMKGL